MSENVVLVERADTLRPAASKLDRLALPIVAAAGPSAVRKSMEVFAARIANRRTRTAYGRAVGQFLACARPGSSRSRRSRRCTWRGTSGRTPDQCPRPKRRLIQQGLSREGFDRGAPDGLFG